MCAKRLLIAFAFAVGVGPGGPAFAADDPFLLSITVTGQSAQTRNFGFNNVEDAIDQLDVDELGREFGYQGNEGVDVLMDYRGLPVTLGFATGTATLEFAVPGLAIDANGNDRVSFTGQSGRQDLGEARRDALEQLKDFLETNKLALRAILTKLARVSPIDPLAGNPLSLQSQMIRRNFEHGFTHKVSQIWGCGTTAFELNRERPIMLASASDDLSGLLSEAQNRAAALRGENEFGLGAVYQNSQAPIRGSSMRSGEYSSYSLTLPLSYTVNMDASPGHKLRFDFPLTATDSGGSKSYALGLGLGYTYPVNEVWSLTPAIGVGVTGSADLGSAGGITSFSIASSYTHRFANFAFSVGNLIGRYSSLGLKFGDVEAEADVKNTVLTNGIIITGPNSLIARNLVVEYSFTDTRLSGDEVYSDYYDEIGVSLGRINTEQGVITSYLKGGLSYVVGDQDLKGLKLNLALRF